MDDQVLEPRDERGGRDPHEVSFGLPRIAAPALVIAALLLVGAGLTTDSAGRVAGGVAAAVLLLGAGWASQGPTLTADRRGATVRGLITRRRLGWDDVVAIHTNDRRRTRGLEFETTNRLVVVPASLLGRETTSEVAAAVSALWEQFRSEPAQRARPPD